jgi:hypothetical protein
MFFAISSGPHDNFSKTYQLSPSFTVSTDEGWQQRVLGQYQVVYKGYADSGPLDTLLDQIVTQHEPKLLGNFCAIVVDTQTNTLNIKSDRYRSFPIYIKDGEITNLVPGGRTAWTDSLIRADANYHTTEDKFDVIGEIDTSIMSWADALDTVDSILLDRTRCFVKHNTAPVRVHLSGGVDSLLVYSYFRRLNAPVELIKCQHMDYDRFWLMNFSTVQKNYWAYRQLHHWTDACVLTSGAPGDEFMLRSPTTIQRYARANDIDILAVLQSSDCLHSEYFRRYLDVFATQEEPIADHGQLIHSICNTIVNDWQHWHLGHTLTYTPLRDLAITKTMLRLDKQAVSRQMFDSEFSVALINRTEPDLSRLISAKKNTGNYMSNLVDFLLDKS